MEQFGVLIVDDSAFMRRAISLLVEQDPQLFVVGIARNGEEAIEKVERFNPDVVTMDIEMPELDGITALQRIMSTCPVPVVMLSTQTGDGTQATLKALEIGAVDFFLKGDLLKEAIPTEIVQDFLSRLKLAARAKLQQKQPNDPSTGGLRQEGAAKMSRSSGQAAELLFIGCSTGGPSALQSILPRFQEDFPVPIFVVQHMPPGFTKPLADRFNTICRLEVKEAEEGEAIKRGTIYIAPAGFQTVFRRHKDGLVHLHIEGTTQIETLFKPSVDVTLHSAAPIYKDRLVSVILTGMGVDGLSGCAEVKKNSGRVITEAEGSCIVYGMPKAVYDAGLADRQVLLPNIYNQIIAFC